MDLAKKKCVPCEIGTAPMEKEKALELLKAVPEWELIAEEPPFKLTRKFKFKDFLQSMDFVNQVAKIAEQEGHHPDILIVWNKVTLTLFTHAAQGLSENDFIMAAKINSLSL